MIIKILVYFYFFFGHNKKRKENIYTESKKDLRTVDDELVALID